MNKDLLMRIGFILSMFLGGCSSDEDKKNIMFSLKTFKNPFFIEIQEGAQSYFDLNEMKDEYNLIFRAGENHNDTRAQREHIELAINQKYDAICLTPVSSLALNSEIAKAYKTGMKIIIVDTKIDEDDLIKKKGGYNLYIGSDNYIGGKKAAQYILTKTKSSKPKIIFFEGVQDQETAIERKSGFLSVLKDNDISIYESFVGNWSRRDAYDQMRNFLSTKKAEEGFDAIFASNDEMCLGAIEAIIKSGSSLKGKIIIGFDAIPEALESINQGQMTATIRQNARRMGEVAIKAVLEKDDLNKVNLIPVEVIE